MRIWSNLLIIGLLVVLPSYSGAAATATLPDKLTVIRIDPLHQFSSNYETNIMNLKQILELYNKFMHLPPFPEGILNCPMDSGVRYELSFIHGSETVKTAMVNVTGCQGVTIDHQSYWALEPNGNGFLSSLKKTLGIKVFE